MSLNKKMLKIARLSRGMTLAELSTNSGIDKAFLSKIESGVESPNDSHIERISSALDYPISFFAQEISESRYNDFFYRKRVTMPVKEKDCIDARIEVMKLMYDRLVSLADIPEPKLLSLSSQKFSPETIANMAREFYGVGKGPVLKLVNTLEKNGIGIIYIDTDSEKFDGVTTYTEAGYPLIILNKNMPNDRKRFTIAHELGHITMHFPFRFDNDFYDRMQNEKDNVYEKEADNFASEFLMPSDEVFFDLQGLTYGMLGMLKQYWNVSKSAIIRKAKDLKVIDERKYKFLMIELSRNGERKSESGGITIDDPQILRKLIDVNLEEQTSEDLAQYLYISQNDLKEHKDVHSGNRLRIVV